MRLNNLIAGQKLIEQKNLQVAVPNLEVFVLVNGSYKTELLL